MIFFLTDNVFELIAIMIRNINVNEFSLKTTNEFLRHPSNCSKYYAISFKYKNISELANIINN